MFQILVPLLDYVSLHTPLDKLPASLNIRYSVIIAFYSSVQFADRGMFLLASVNAGLLFELLTFGRHLF